MRRLAVLILAALSIAGCYESRTLLVDPRAARQPITTAEDWTYTSGKDRVHARLSPRADGWYDYGEARVGPGGRDGDWSRHRVVLNDLGHSGNFDLFVYGTYHDDHHAFMYGVVAVGPGGSWHAVTPSCDPAVSATWYKPDVRAATQGGGTLRTLDDMEQVCQFTSRAALFQAMHNVVAQPGFSERLKKTGRD